MKKISKSIATSAIIPASGLGRRLTSDVHKAFVPLLGRPLIIHTLAVFQESSEVAEIVLVVPSQHIARAQQLVSDYGLTKVRSVVAGGETRRDSVRNGLSQISSNCEIVLIHDGARPLVHHDVIAASIEAAKVDGAAIAAVPVIDTIKSSRDGQYVSKTLERDRLYAVQTPQTFQREIIQQAYEQAYADGYVGTDDASLVERLGLPVRIVTGSYDNIKVTTPTDLIIAECLLARHHVSNLECLRSE
ncbi:MAG: 2-C-methyl-D-erythritol 4-phosphate cytidylyltransferase, partial [Armatimonadota bacterium]